MNRGEPAGGPLAGMARLLRLALRRDRILLPAWLAVLVLLLFASVASVVGLYSDEASRQSYAMVAASNAVARAFDGPASGTSLGAVTMTETFGVLAVLVGIMSVQTVVRHTRQEEETGRAELVGAAAVGRHASLTAALLVAGLANLALGVVATVTLVANDLPLTGSLAAAGALVGVGLSFAGVAAVTAQVFATQRGANGIGTAAVGAAFLLRAVGDAAGHPAESGVRVISAFPSWLSPIGWGQQLRAFEDERWWVLGLFAGLVVVTAALGYVLAAHRDLGAGMVETRPGPPDASPRLRSPLGLAWRLQRGVVLGWAVGLAILGAAFGAVGDEAEELASTSEELADMLATLGQGDLVDLYFSFFLAIFAIAAAGFTIQVLLRARTEEGGGRAEPVLATAVSRPAWLLSHVVVAAVGTLVIMLLAGLATGFSYSLVTGSADRLVDLLIGSVVHVPAVWALGGFVVAATGVLPRWAAALGWGGLVASFVMGQLGALFELPQALLNVSPFTHTPAVPAEDLSGTPLVALLVVAVGLTVVGVATFRRRDLVL